MMRRLLDPWRRCAARLDAAPPAVQAAAWWAVAILAVAAAFAGRN